MSKQIGNDKRNKYPMKRISNGERVVSKKRGSAAHTCVLYIHPKSIGSNAKTGTFDLQALLQQTITSLNEHGEQ